MVLPLGIKRIRDDSARDAIPRVVSTAHRDHRDLREAAAHDGEKFKSGHLRHIEIGDDDVRRQPSQLQKTVKPVLGRTDVISCALQNQGQAFANGWFIIY